ncbi:LysR family transcriptional regulator [Abyssibacter profundi]|uniref:LysR family transcriptional regulator n=1 Tax=Abyssibacter profundi TaxID=2182787 RepID=A0A363UJC4_9GAMM|nr:LysR family transcriptional regulator [Abyssibacter profundi]PWN55521.1 LysR family transcriptional regulator [Abyssibacter profundi]
MDQKALETFVAVAQAKSFSVVARARNVAPSSISRAIHALEGELGVRLLQRSTRRLALTEAGQRYLAQIEGVLDALAQANADARDAAETPRGHLRLTASSAFTESCIVPVLTEFRNRYPQITVEILATEERIDLIENNLDLAIRLGPQADSGLIARRLARVHYHVVASPQWLEQHGRPRQPDDLSSVDCCRYTFGGFRDHWHYESESGQALQVNVAGQFLCSNPLALKRAALESNGPALLARWLVHRELDNGSLVSLFPETKFWVSDRDPAVWLLMPSRKYLPSKLRCFVEFLSRKVGQPDLAV